MRREMFSVWLEKMAGLSSANLSHESCVCIARFSACGRQKKSVVYETEFRYVAVQRGKHDQNHL